MLLYAHQMCRINEHILLLVVIIDRRLHNRIDGIIFTSTVIEYKFWKSFTHVCCNWERLNAPSLM